MIRFVPRPAKRSFFSSLIIVDPLSLSASDRVFFTFNATAIWSGCGLSLGLCFMAGNWYHNVRLFDDTVYSMISFLHPLNICGA